VINHRAEDIAEGVRAATDGRGADVIYDPVGGDAFASATQCVAPEGRILAIGFASGRWGETDTSHLVYNNYSVVGVIPTFYDRAFKERTQERLLGWWREGKLSPRIETLLAFEDLPDGLERLVAGGAKGKFALAVDPSATAPA
jgi:NADPH2:quinone reductase